MEAFFIYLIKSASILSLFLIIYMLFLKKETLFSANRWYLLTGIATALLLPFFYITEIVWIDAAPVYTAFYQEIPTQAQALPSSIDINWWLVLGVIYSIGVLVMSSRFLIQLWSLKKLLRTHEAFQKEGILYTEVNENIAPFSFGNHIVYNPKKHSAQELDLIIKHEQEHVKQNHTLDLLISNLLLVSQWCNPLAWVYKNCLEQNLEFLADRKTLENNTSKRDYQLAMVRVSASNRFPEITTNFYQSFIKKRIIMLNKDASKAQRLWKLGLIVPCLVVFIYTFNIKTVAQERPLEIQETPIYQAVLTSPEVDESSLEQPLVKKAVLKTQKTVATTTASKNIGRKTASTNTSHTPVGLTKSMTVTITSSTTDAELDKIVEKFKKQGVTVKFKSVKRRAGLITGIKVDAKKGDTSSNFEVNKEGGISPISIAYNSDSNSLNVGSASTHPKKFHIVHSSDSDEHPTNVWISKDTDSISIGGDAKHYAFFTKGDDSLNTHKKIIINRFVSDSIDRNVNYFFKSSDDDDHHSQIMINGKVIHPDSLQHISGGNNKTRIFISGDVTEENDHFRFEGDKSFYFIGDDEDSGATEYYINGKKVDKAAIKALDSDDIKTVNIEKDGDMNKLKITTKKN